MIYSPEHKNTLLNFDLKSFLEDFSGNDIEKIKKLYPGIYRLLAEQIDIYPKALIKLPSFTANYCYFTRKSYEQSTSELPAKFKASLFKENLLIDLTGGFGADDAAFSGTFARVVSVDPDEELNQLARVNFEKLGISNIERIDSTAEDFIKQKLKADLIYIDPDRRQGSKRTITLEDSIPAIPEILERVFEISQLVLLKLSPLIDLTYLKKNLPNIEKLYIISLENEVKEILVLLKKPFDAVAETIAVDLAKDQNPLIFSSTESAGSITEYSSEGKYFYEPSKSIIKAGLVDKYSEHTNLKRIGKSSPYLVSSKKAADFMGRAFEIVRKSVFSKSGFRGYLKDNLLLKANISRRDFPLTVDEIRKQYGISDGGEDYLFFTTSFNGEKMFYHCRKTV